MNIEQARKAAKNEEMSAEVLAELADSEDSETRQYVAANPNTPIEVLKKLGKEFPEEITNNPIFNLLVLEEPDSKFIRLSLARSSTTDQETLEKLIEIEEEDILCAITSNLNASISLLEMLAIWTPEYTEDDEYYSYDDYPGSNVHACVAANPNTPLSILEKLANHDSSIVIKKVAENPKTSPEILEKLTQNNGERILLAVSKNINTSVTTLEKLAGEENSEIRSSVLKHPNVSEKAIEFVRFIEEEAGTPISILETLATDKRLHVRQLVADHPFTPSHALMILLTQPIDLVISQCIADHPNASPTVLEKLIDKLAEEWENSTSFFYRENIEGYLESYFPKVLNDKEESKILLSLINHPLITHKALLKLASRENKKTMHAIAALPNISLEIINKLASHGENIEDEEISLVKFEVRKALMKNTNTPSNIIEEFFILVTQPRDNRPYYKYGDHLCTIADHPNTPVSLLEILAKDKHDFSRQAVAENTKTPIHILCQLSNDPDIQVVAEVAKNRNTPLEILTKLAKHYSEYVVSSVASNCNTSVDILKMLLQDNSKFVRSTVAENINTPVSILQKLAQDKSKFVRANIAKNINTPVSILRKLARDKDPFVRVNIARNANTPISVIEKLARDDFEEIVKAVIENPKTTAKIINMLANHSNPEIRCKIAEHSLTYHSTLVKLTQDKNVHVLKKLAKRPDINQPIIEKLTEISLKKIYEQRKSKWNEPMAILSAIAQHPNTPSFILEQLALNLYDDETCNKEIYLDTFYLCLREEVAKNINTPISVLEKLKSQNEKNQNDPLAERVIKKTLKAKTITLND